MTTEKRIPLFPLNTVLFPGGPLVLRIFEPRYLQMIKECASNETEFGVSLILEGHEAGVTATTATTGTSARIVDFFTTQDGLLGIRAVGVQRFRIQRTSVRDDGLIMADVAMLAAPPGPHPVATEHLLLRTLLERLLENVGDYYADSSPRDLDDADWIASRLAELLPLDLALRQLLLEEVDPRARLQKLLEIVPVLQGD